MKQVKFQIGKDATGQFRARFMADNGQILFTSEGYVRRRDAQAAFEAVRKALAGCKSVLAENVGKL